MAGAEKFTFTVRERRGLSGPDIRMYLQFTAMSGNPC